MTDATVTRSGTPARQPAHTTGHRAQPPADDVRAMSDAFARARKDGQSPLGQMPGQGGRPAAERKGVAATAEFRAELAQSAGLRAADERGTLDRREAERGGEQALGLVSPSHAPMGGAAPLPAPPPHVDPSGFAQMLADLWTRENGRGDKRVQVRFGAEAWPATGALLVQNAQGVLEVEIDLAPGNGAGSNVALSEAFRDAGLNVGSLKISAVAA